MYKDTSASRVLEMLKKNIQRAVLRATIDVVMFAMFGTLRESDPGKGATEVRLTTRAFRMLSKTEIETHATEVLREAVDAMAQMPADRRYDVESPEKTT